MSDSSTIEYTHKPIPFDKYNQELLEQVYPTQWVNPIPDGRYNLVVVGAGAAGLVTAAIAAGLGGKVAIIERRLMGGDCLNFGCVPSKAILRCSRAAASVKKAKQFGIQLQGESTVDFPSVMERVRRLRTQISKHDSVHRFSELGIDVFLGNGMFTGLDTVAVEGHTLRFARACIATGANPSTPPIPGLSDVTYHTNESIFSLTTAPRRLAIIGAGPIGCELAQAFARMGIEVHLLEMSDRILAREDHDVSTLLTASLASDGVTPLTSCSIKKIDEDKVTSTKTINV